jgi:hypothetical protein
MENRMNDHDDLAPIFDWDLLSDALGAASLGVLFLAALGLPHLF